MPKNRLTIALVREYEKLIQAQMHRIRVQLELAYARKVIARHLI